MLQFKMRPKLSVEVLSLANCQKYAVPNSNEIPTEAVCAHLLYTWRYTAKQNGIEQHTGFRLGEQQGKLWKKSEVGCFWCHYSAIIFWCKYLNLGKQKTTKNTLKHSGAELFLLFYRTAKLASLVLHQKELRTFGLCRKCEVWLCHCSETQYVGSQESAWVCVFSHASSCLNTTKSATGVNQMNVDSEHLVYLVIYTEI